MGTMMSGFPSCTLTSVTKEEEKGWMNAFWMDGGFCSVALTEGTSCRILEFSPEQKQLLTVDENQSIFKNRSPFDFGSIR